jgi:hypothetical protein
MHKNVYIENIPTTELVPLDYKPQDTSLIVSFDSASVFDPQTDYIEYHIYNGARQLVDNLDSLDSYRLYDNKLNISPEKDLESRGYTQGKYYTYYNFLTPLLSSSIDRTYYISEISSDRTELRLSSNIILGGDIVDGTEALISRIEQAPYYEDFYINFGDNNLAVVSNIALDGIDPDNVTVLIKLYQPLDPQFNINTSCWVVDKVAESTAYLLNIETAFDVVDETIKLQGPNLNIPIKTQENKATALTTLNDLKASPSASLTHQLNSALNVPGVELNTDYSNFSNFVFFSTVRTRLENFYYKLGLIEEYNYSASLNVDSGSFYNSSSLSYWDTQINDVITNFDGYEYYLYFESSSTAWPKSNSTPPYVNVPTTSSQGQTWLTDTLVQADAYDNVNKDQLVDTIPSFIKEDSTNLNYLLFTDMVAQMYDEVWLYIKNVTEKYNSTNGVDQGLSKDLVGQALRDLGIKLYQNNFTSDDLYSTYLGITPSGSLLPNTGQELIETYVTASATGSLIPIDNLSSEIHKRLYHNLPLLLKKKGTAAGLKTLINAFGIPDTILRINEFGGKDKNPNTWDYDQNEYDYAFNTSGDGFVNMGWENNPFEFTINTANTSVGSSNSDQFQLPLVSSLPLNAVVDWGDGTTDTITTWNQAERLHTYPSVGTYTIKITGDLSGWQFAAGGDRLKMLNVLQWSGLNISVGQGFQGCANLTCSATDAPLITSTSLLRYFQDCTNFNGAIGNWDMSNVTSMNRMFRTTPSFNQPIGNWSVQNVTVMLEMFEGATAFNQDIGSWNVSNVLNFTDFMNGKTAANYSAANLDSIYNGWSSLPSVKPNISIKFGTIKYTAAGQAGKDILTNAPNNWTITDGGI